MTIDHEPSRLSARQLRRQLLHQRQLLGVGTDGCGPRADMTGLNQDLLGAAPFNPSSVTGLILWLKADVGLYQDTGTSTPATVNNDPVGHWLDQSSSGNNATFVSGTDGNKGYLSTNAVNSKNAVGFDGSLTASLTLDSAISSLGTYTIYAVGTRANSSKWIPVAHHTTPGMLEFPFSDNNVYITSTQGNSVSTAYTGATGAICTRARWVAGGGAQNVYFAATSMTEVLLGQINHNSDLFTVNQIGGRGSASQWNGTGNLYCEILLYNADVVTDNPTGNTNILSYLNTRWGVTI